MYVLLNNEDGVCDDDDIIGREGTPDLFLLFAFCFFAFFLFCFSASRSVAIVLRGGRRGGPRYLPEHCIACHEFEKTIEFPQ